MIASYTHDFIYLKTYKTGSTSTEIVLSSWCMPRDICTPFVVSQDEALRARYGGRAMGAWFGLSGPHASAAEVRAWLPDLWQRAYKFTVERHPFEKVVSRASWTLRKRGFGDIGAEIERTIATRAYLNFPIYTIDGTLAVDEVIPYERMWERLRELGARWGRTLPVDLPRAKGAVRTDRRPAREILSAAQRSIVEVDAAHEIEVLARAASRSLPKFFALAVALATLTGCATQKLL